MGTTDIIAILGAVTGVPAFLIQLLSFKQARPIIKIRYIDQVFRTEEEFTSKKLSDGSRELHPASYVEIVNLGHIPTTVLSLEVAVSDSKYAKYLYLPFFSRFFSQKPRNEVKSSRFVAATAQLPRLLSSGDVWCAHANLSPLRGYKKQGYKHSYIKLVTSDRDYPRFHKITLSAE